MSWKDIKIVSSYLITKYEIDKLEMVFQAKYYCDKGYPKEKLRSFFQTANIEIKSKYLREMLSKFLE